MIVSSFTNLMLRVVTALVWIGMNSFGYILEKPTRGNLFILFCIHISIGILLGYASTFVFDYGIIKHYIVDLINLVLAPALVGALFLSVKKVVYKKAPGETERFNFMLIYTNVFFFICTRMVLI